jgi:tetrapyrrole methylase family protein/MazG family protein
VENSKIKSEKDSIKGLIALVESLRGDPGCPWDKRQTPRSMLIYLIEEMYELADAIESNRAEEVREELGDVLFHIIFITRLFQEAGEFSVRDVARDITEKMIRRHPHVFGTARVDNADEVRKNWHKIKQHEKKSTGKASVLDSVPKKMPTLMRAYRIVERTVRCGFNRQDRQNLLNTLNAEFDQLQLSIKHKHEDRISSDFGSLLLSLVHLAQHLKIHPETALSAALQAYEMQFKKMEKGIAET